MEKEFGINPEDLLGGNEESINKSTSKEVEKGLEKIRDNYSEDVFGFIKDKGMDDFSDIEGVKSFINREEHDEKLYEKYKEFPEFGELVAQLSLTPDVIVEIGTSEKIGLKEDFDKLFFQVASYENAVFGEDYVSPGDGKIKDFQVAIEKIRLMLLMYRGETGKNEKEGIELFENMFVLNLAQQFKRDGQEVPPKLKMLVKNEYLEDDLDASNKGFEDIDVDIEGVWNEVKDEGIKDIVDEGAHPEIAERKYNSKMNNSFKRVFNENPDGEKQFVNDLFEKYGDIRVIIKDILG